MPDQTEAPPTKRMTTAEVAALAQQIDGRLDDLSAVVTDVSTRLQDIGTGSTSGQHADLITPDAVDGRIHEALAPLHDEVHALRGALNNPATASNVDAILARLEDAERKVAAVDPGALTEKAATALHPTLSTIREEVKRTHGDLDTLKTEARRRLDKVEEQSARVAATVGGEPVSTDYLKNQVAAAVQQALGDPVSHSLAEDALADQIQATVERTVNLVADDVQRLNREFADLRQHVETHGTHVTRALVNEVAAALPASAAPAVPSGLGAARKVLQLMRLVTHIGKERQADMGQGGRFKFRGIDEAMDAVGHAMREVGLILSPEVLKEENSTTPVTKKGDGKNGPYESTVLWTTTKLTMRYTFVDPDDGSTHPIEMVGEGRDASDKSTSKAGSMAFKYALLQALCIPTTGLDDSDAAPPQIMENERDAATAQRPQQQATPERTEQDKARRAGEALAAIRNVYRVEGGPQAQYNRLVQIMNQVKGEGLLQFSVEGSTLNQHGEAAMRTLQAPPPPDDARASTEPPEPPAGY